MCGISLEKMSSSLTLAALFSALCLILDIPKAVGNRMPTATSRPFRQETTNSKPPIYSEEFQPHRQSPPLYSEELKPKPPMYSEELKPIRTKQARRHSEESRQQHRTKPRAYSSSKENSTRPIYSEELKPTSRTKPTTYSEEFIQSTTPLNYGSRRKPRPMCGTDCNKPVKKRKTQIVPSQSNRQKLIGAKNETSAPPSEKPIRFSHQYSPDGDPSGGGFVPMPSPYVPTARTARSRTEELTAKESRPSPNILGNGNFEILSGGVFPEEETNEIPQGRRVGRTGRTYDNFPFRQQRFQQVPFNVQNFQFPAFYPNRHQLPAHPLFFPRGAF